MISFNPMITAGQVVKFGNRPMSNESLKQALQKNISRASQPKELRWDK